ncbi:DUF397 domain-containing protein [Saccharopolyspora sp. 5N708]|uniref:DUF397 domain-containing protein n=1 Tax=Saccharopolyspora sp. 5N708 TaxID=3457424 RepID=UPI003FD698AF
MQREEAIHWRKSSYSPHNNNCVEVGWRKSTRSTSGGNCVEVGLGVDVVGVRDSKDRDGGQLSVGPAQWRAFLLALAENRIG